MFSSINFNEILDVNKTTCMFDPFPTRLLLNFSNLFIDVIVRIIS